MLNCWDENSTNRASFTQLRKRFDAMLSSMASKVSVIFFNPLYYNTILQVFWWVIRYFPSFGTFKQPKLSLSAINHLFPKVKRNVHVVPVFTLLKFVYSRTTRKIIFDQL